MDKFDKREYMQSDIGYITLSLTNLFKIREEM